MVVRHRNDGQKSNREQLKKSGVGLSAKRETHNFPQAFFKRLSEMPCRLIDGLHEWRNEISTVPNRIPPKILSWCTSQGRPVGSEDPVKLYCSLLL
jgi:hypothetical protein